MVLGVASRASRTLLASRCGAQARDAAFYLLNASMAIRALEVPIGFGVWAEAWNVIAWSGPLGVLAMSAANIVMTVRQQPASTAQTAIPVQALQPLPRS